MFKKIAIIGLIILGILLGIFVHNKLTYVGEKVDPLTYFDEFNKNTNNLVYEDIRIPLDEPVALIGDELYVRYDFANTYVSDIIFYDEQEQVMTLTSPKEVVRLYPGRNTIEYMGIEGTYELTLVENLWYVSANLLEDFFGVTISESTLGGLYIATNEGETQRIGTLKKTSSLRTHPKEKSTVMEEMKKGKKVIIYSEENGFVRVRSESGIVGFIPETDIGKEKEQPAMSLPSVEAWEVNPLGETVKMVWDQITTQTERDWLTGKYASIDNINVISPTWFEFGDESGKLISRAVQSYVQVAHSRGIQVWPILSHSFEDSSLTQAILTSTEKRQYVIDQIIQYAKDYGFDGINIDIENIQVETSQVWVQFMRELYPSLKQEGLIVSVDVYMPSNWSKHYEREKVAQNCDYFMVMAYDQHWSGSETAGSVSEIPWVQKGIEASLSEVPKEKLVLGIPFYTRLWIERSNGLNVKSYSMASINEVIAPWNVTAVLDENSGQNYVEYIAEDGVYKVWLEDSYSVSKRIGLMQSYDLAGYAAWRLGHETKDIWDILSKVE